ncbi:MAG: dCMP deaminase family protein [Rhodospirillales bacterium]|nr:dCMP deaminase family protein [Rhodospirillales bacterium]
MSDKWDIRFLRLAREVSTWSKDRSTQVGAAIVDEDRTPGPYGYNGFPRFIDDEKEERHERPNKYDWTEHAERNAIYNAARMGMTLKGGTIYVTHVPCADCARAIIQVGIVRVVADAASMEDGDFSVRWSDAAMITKEMLDEAGIALDLIHVPERAEEDGL